MSKPSSVVLGLDIGGTTAKMGIVSPEGEILRRAEEPMPHHLAAQTLVENVKQPATELLHWARQEGYDVLGCGVSVCGFITPDGERPEYVNVHALDGFPLRQELQGALDLPVILDNDMNCAVLGEYHYGAGKGVSRLLVVTVGTGIGVGVILNDQLLRLSSGTTGNPGHVIVDPHGPVCVAGCRGCVESLASAGPISRRAEALARSQRPTQLRRLLEDKGHLTPEDVFVAAEAGDLPAQEIWREVGEWLGRGLATWVQIFAPSVVLVGGGVAHAQDWLIRPMEREMRRVGEPYFTRQVREVKSASLKKELGVLGAASLFFVPRHASPGTIISIPHS